MTARWSNYVFANGDSGVVGDLLSAAASTNSSSLYVLGVGFDPRCLVGLKAFLNLEHQHKPHILRIGLGPPAAATQPSVSALAASHASDFEHITQGYTVSTVSFPAVESRYSAGTAIARDFSAVDRMARFSHIVIDISSLPSVLYFPIIKAVLQAYDRPPAARGHFGGNIQIVACENAMMDSYIYDLGVSGAGFIGGFRQRSVSDSDVDRFTIWVPVMGENSEPALRAIHTLLDPSDICPVLPFPAAAPRRADSLVLEYRTMLFEAFQVRSSDFVYSDERNPFDLYRSLCDLDRAYSSALRALGSTTVALSEHSSKLLSLGVLLAAYERDLPIVAAGVSDYGIVEGIELADFGEANELCCLWLTGAPYQSKADK